MLIARSQSDDKLCESAATAPCMSCGTRMHFAQARSPMSCIPLVIIMLRGTIFATKSGQCWVLLLVLLLSLFQCGLRSLVLPHFLKGLAGHTIPTVFARPLCQISTAIGQTMSGDVQIYVRQLTKLGGLETGQYAESKVLCTFS